jgi:hypothetical protein
MQLLPTLAECDVKSLDALSRRPFEGHSALGADALVELEGTHLLLSDANEDDALS